MNESTDVRSTGSTKPAASSKTDTAVPVERVSEVAETASEAAAGPAVPARPQPTDRLISGIDLIDFSVGGLIPNHMYVVKGGVGVGKSLLGLQFLTRGLDHHEPGILITDQRPQKVVDQARAIGFNLDEPLRRNQLAILNPSKRYFELVESPADVLAIVDELSDLVKKMGAKRLVIDPVFTLINTSYSSHFASTLTQSLVNALEDLPVTTILVASDDDQPELNPITRILEQNASGVIALTSDTTTGGRMMRLCKLSFANSDNLCAHYRILNGRGLINYRGDGEQVTDVTQPWEEAANRRVLILGAQPETIRRVKESLGAEYEVDAEGDLQAGLARVRKENPGLVLVTPSRSVGAVNAILDLARNTTSSIAFLSPSNNRQSDKVLYLRAGADDFITEPFSPAELRARVDALIRRSGRRLNVRDNSIGSITPEELSALMQNEGDNTATRRRGPVMRNDDGRLSFDPEFNDRIQRSVETVSKFDQPFALYWIKADENEKDLNRSLAQLCRQEDIVCQNRNGEFVCILTGTDDSGIKGFETRLNEKLGDKLDPKKVRRGYTLHTPGQPTDNFAQRATER